MCKVNVGCKVKVLTMTNAYNAYTDAFTGPYGMTGVVVSIEDFLVQVHFDVGGTVKFPLDELECLSCP